MKMFTFLGTGDYKECLTHFRGEEEEFDCCRFLQNHIYDTYKDEITSLKVFCTPQAREKHWDAFCKTLDGAPLEMVPIEFNMSSEQFASMLVEQIDDEDEIIFDVTHSFRELPMKLLFVLKSVEIMKNAHIRHIYYGQTFGLNSDPDSVPECIINDVVEDYRMQKIAELLGQFDRTLIMTRQDWEGFAEENGKINAFMKALTDFNEMIEFCELDKAAAAVAEVKNRARSLLKDPETNILLMPLARRIDDKLPDRVSNRTQTVINLIQLLLEHRRYQVAITFADQLYASVLVKKAAETNDYRSLARKMRSHLDPESFRYQTDLLVRRAVEDGDFGIYDYEKGKIAEYSGWDMTAIEDMHSIYLDNKDIVDTFHQEIRNHMNHGYLLSGKGKKSVEETLAEFLKVISLMEAI